MIIVKAAFIQQNHREFFVFFFFLKNEFKFEKQRNLFKIFNFSRNCFFIVKCLFDLSNLDTPVVITVAQ